MFLTEPSKRKIIKSKINIISNNAWRREASSKLKKKLLHLLKMAANRGPMNTWEWSIGVCRVITKEYSIMWRSIVLISFQKDTQWKRGGVLTLKMSLFYLIKNEKFYNVRVRDGMNRFLGWRGVNDCSVVEACGEDDTQFRFLCLRKCQ